jgi:hypothetical protein
LEKITEKKLFAVLESKFAKKHCRSLSCSCQNGCKKVLMYTEVKKETCLAELDSEREHWVLRQNVDDQTANRQNADFRTITITMLTLLIYVP